MRSVSGRQILVFPASSMMSDSSPDIPGFHGRIGRTREESVPNWPARQNAVPRSPNIVIVYMDEIDWSDPRCYGSEIDTPHVRHC